jgi:methionyl-tRNA formyltransferase
MKIVFMGTPEFASTALERLIASPHQVALAITQPDRPKGRGQKLEPPPVKVLALAHGIPVLQPRSVRREDIASAIRETSADAIIVAAFGQILPREVLEATRLGCLNIHPSLLPAWRGAAPIQRCLLEGASDTGVTIMQLDEAMDHGPIIAQQSIEILADDDARSLADMLSVLGADMLVRVLDEAEKEGRIESVPQDHALATLAPAIKKEEGLIPWTDPTERIMYRLRAMTPWPGAFTFIGGERQLTILQAEPLREDEAEELDETIPKAKPGTVTSLMKDLGFTVKTGNGHLLVNKVKPEGKKQMEGWAYIIGRNIAVGEKLGPPRTHSLPE